MNISVVHSVKFFGLGNAQIVEDVRRSQNSLPITWWHNYFYQFPILNLTLWFWFWFHFCTSSVPPRKSAFERPKEEETGGTMGQKKCKVNKLSKFRRVLLFCVAPTTSIRKQRLLSPKSFMFLCIDILTQWGTLKAMEPILQDRGLGKVLLEDYLLFLVSDIWPFWLQRVNLSESPLGITYIPKQDR